MVPSRPTDPDCGFWGSGLVWACARAGTIQTSNTSSSPARMRRSGSGVLISVIFVIFV
jgi:hypothetical protein